MATQIITRNGSGSVPTVSSGADINRGATLSATDYDQNLVNLRSAVDTALSGVALTMSSANPLMDGSVSPGSSSSASRSDHRHPSDTLKEDRQAVATARVNLGNPLVTEKALFKGQFNNKFQFFLPSLIEDSFNDGSSWATSLNKFPTSDSMKDVMVGDGNTPGWLTIERGAWTRITWDNSLAGSIGYVFLQHLYIYLVTAIHSLRVTIELHDGASWRLLGDQASINCWPGHLSFPHTTEAFFQSYKVRLTFMPTWSTDTGSPYYTQPIIIYSIEWWGGYPAGKRDIFLLDRNKGATFPAAVNATSFTSATLQTTGNVGIGGTANQRLTVSGLLDAGTSQMNILNTGGGNLIIKAGISGITNQGATFSLANIDNTNITDVMYFSSACNVGIGGTASPTNRLFIRDSAQNTNAQIRLHDGISAVAHGYVGNWANGVYLQTGGHYKSGVGWLYDTPSSTVACISMFGTSAGSVIDFSTFPTINQSPTSRMNIDKDGKIGIGTTSQTSLLHVYKGASGVSGSNATLIIENNSHQYLGFQAPANMQSGILFGHPGAFNYSGINWEDGSRGDYLNFTAGNVFTMAMKAGKVGVGTVSPNYTLEVNGSFAATTKSFVIDHPTKKGKKLRYGSLEGPENGVYVRGKLKDKFVIHLPEYWSKLVDPASITVSLTAIGQHQKFYVESIIDNKIFLKNDNPVNKKIECFYVVYGERVDVEKLTVEFKA